MMTPRPPSFAQSILSLALLAPAALAAGCITVEHAGGGATCAYAGEDYEVGESFPANDGCNTCSCTEGGDVACTKRACESPYPNCEMGGQVYLPGDTWQADCNTCECLDDGTTSCTLIWCGTCEHAGQTYSAGESFPAADGCNTCTCGEDGAVGCTEMACTCDPESEPHRRYVSLDPAECRVIDFDCSPPEVLFFEGCGCGCEIPAD